MITVFNKNIEQHISLSTDKFFNIVIESPTYLRSFVIALKEQLNSGQEFLMAYDEKGNIVNLSKISRFIEFPISIDMDEKKTNLIIQKDIGTHIAYDKKEQFELLKKTIGEYVHDITYDYPLPVYFDEDMNLTTFLKAISLSYLNNSETILEDIINQIKVSSFVSGYKIFFFLNPHDFFSNKEISTLFSQLDLLDISYVLISSHAPRHKIDKEFLIIIDEDLCELHVE